MRSFSELMCMALMDGSFIGLGACPRGARLCFRLSGFTNPSLESSGRLSDADLPSVDHDATSGGIQRMTGGQDEAGVADRSKGPQIGGIDDPRTLDHVPERAVRHRHRDPVAAAQAVDVPERRA